MRTMSTTTPAAISNTGILPCPAQMHTECVNDDCKCVQDQGMSTGLVVAAVLGGGLIASLIALGFYQAYKGIKPVYVTPGGANIYL